MDGQTQRLVEILNRLKRGAAEGKVLWEHAGTCGRQFAAPLDNGHRAVIAETPNGSAVIFTMTNGQGLQTIYLDSSRVNEELLRLALLQLFVTVRNTFANRIADEALDAVREL